MGHLVRLHHSIAMQITPLKGKTLSEGTASAQFPVACSVRQAGRERLLQVEYESTLCDSVYSL